MKTIEASGKDAGGANSRVRKGGIRAGELILEAVGSKKQLVTLNPHYVQSARARSKITYLAT